MSVEKEMDAMIQRLVQQGKAAGVLEERVKEMDRQLDLVKKAASDGRAGLVERTILRCAAAADDGTLRGGEAAERVRGVLRALLLEGES